MAKSSRGGLTVYDKQDVVISQFAKIVRNEQYRKEPTWFEQQVIDSKTKTEEYKNRMAKTTPQPRISFYNPDNILNRTRHLSAEDRKIAIKQFLKEEKAAANLINQ
jgi:hypothetical protein